MLEILPESVSLLKRFMFHIMTRADIKQFPVSAFVNCSQLKVSVGELLLGCSATV
jgi:hypothetical protein